MSIQVLVYFTEVCGNLHGCCYESSSTRNYWLLTEIDNEAYCHLRDYDLGNNFCGR